MPIKTPQHVHDGLRCRFIQERKGYSGTICSDQSESHREHPQADRYKFKKMFPKVTGHRNKEEVYKIDETKPTEEGTVFETAINNTKMNALFDTGATKSVMSGKMYRNLKLGPLDDSNLPSVVGANGSSLGVMGRIRCTIAFEKEEDKFDQTFLVCENLQRGVILGKDFARQNCAGVYWTPHNTRVLHMNLKTIAETKELVPSGTAAIHVKQTTKLPPRSLAVVDVNINTTRDAKHVMPIKLIPDLEWEFIENISMMESDKGVTIYCINETEDENEDTQVTKVSEPKTDDKTPENIEPIVTEAVEAPGATQSKKPTYKHREISKIATKDAVPRESPEIVAEDAVPRESMEGSRTQA